MSQRRGIVTDRLTNVIQVIQLGKKTGRLIAERGEGTQREDGVMLFARGQITEAQTGSLHGAAAMDWLRTWGKCRFIFEAEESERTTGSLPFQLSPAHDTGSHPVQRLTPGNDHQNGADPRHSGQFPATRVSSGQEDTSTSGKLPAFQKLSPPPLPSGTPRRTKQDEMGMRILTQAGLSRVHLRLYLLIDGRRNITELLRLMGRPPEEVQQLLDDLRSLGIIHY